MNKEYLKYKLIDLVEPLLNNKDELTESVLNELISQVSEYGIYHIKCNDGILKLYFLTSHEDSFSMKSEKTGSIFLFSNKNSYIGCYNLDRVLDLSIQDYRKFFLSKV